ncbi:MAG: hypothetical protein U9Q12_01200 [Patescibacteria group bacterium]|nr:hypothetical protein [Patescibacteria group bacterium]
MGFFSKATDDVVDQASDAAKDVTEDKIDDVAQATGMEDNAMVEGAADKAVEMGGEGIDTTADKVKDATGGDEGSAHTCEGDTCSHE